MSIRRNNARREQWEKDLERFCPTKLTLVRANVLNCAACLADGGQSVLLSCSTCGGTGYNGGVRGQSLDTAPCSTLYYMHADIQVGPNISLGAGNDVLIHNDLGRLDTNQAIMFCKVSYFDRLTGIRFNPDTSQTFPRPDRIIGRNGDIYNMARALTLNVGDDEVCRAYLVTQGNYR